MARTPQISTSSFKPLSLDEIMMVPLAKQKMEDQLLAGSDKVGELEASTLSPDQEKANLLISGYKNRASSLSDEVINKGVDRSQFNKLRSLRNEVNAEYGASGFLGKAIANNKAASQYVNDLATKKERQAGWSPQEAKQWAMRQVAGFQGTQNEDGTFNTFSGSELATKVDEADWIRKNIDDVAEQVSSTALRAIKVGGLPAFQQAFANQEVSSKDFNTIMRHLNTQARTDKDLQRSLMQSAAFTGEENPLDFGKFEIKTFKQKDGTEASREVWVPGKSRFGYRMSGMADAADYRNVKVNHKIVKDDAALEMWKMGMQERQALDLISFAKGEMNELNPDTIETVQKNLDLYGTQSKQFLSEANNRLKELMAGGMDEATAKADPKYKRLYNSYSESNVSYMNSKARIDNMYSKVDSKLSDEDKNIFELSNTLDRYDGDAIKALREEFNTEVSKEWLSQGYGRNEKDEAERILARKLGVDMSKAGRGRADFSAIPYIIDEAKRRRTKVAQKYLEANPQAEHFTIINALATGKYSSKYGAWQDLKGKNFNVKSSDLAYGKGPLSESPEFAELGDSKKGFDYIVSPTDGYDDSGSYFNNVVVTNKDTGQQASFQVRDGLSSGMLSEMAKDLQSGSYQQRKLGDQLEANINFMPAIKKSGMLWQDRGFMKISLGGGVERDDVEYVKTDDGYYNVFIGKIPVELNGRTDLAGEKEVALALNNEVKAINKYRLSQQDKK